MEKKYCDFLSEISPEELYVGLLCYGMFAKNLPPIFTSLPFFNYSQTKKVKYSEKEWHDFVSYTSMRNINIPRVFGIPTPMKYLNLCKVLKDNWELLKKHFYKQTLNQDYKISRIHLRKMKDKRELFEMNYKNWKVDGSPDTDLLFLNNCIKKASKYLVKADISTCFPSFYSHSIPWALVGKQQSKINSCKDDLWYNKIDNACSSLKNGETHGLLIGPHASNLLSEVVLTCIDKILYDKDYRFIRNIDDYDCYVDSFEQAQQFLHDLEEALHEFDFSMNHKKTAILKLPIPSSKNWVHRLNSYLSVVKGEMDYKAINSFVDLAISLALENGDSAVLKYAIKAIAGSELSYGAKKLAAKRILHLSILYPYLIPIIEYYVFEPLDVSVDLIKDYSDALYVDSKKSFNYEGIYFAIYYSIRYGFKLDTLDIDWVIKRGDCVLLLMTWLYYLNINNGNKRATDLKPLIKIAKNLKDVNMDRYWLFCYEVLPINSLAGDWKQVKKNDVSFLSINKPANDC